MYTAAGEYTERHLTPRGWEKGTEVTDSGRTSRLVPVDRLRPLKISCHS
jgi:hypothetical protein